MVIKVKLNLQIKIKVKIKMWLQNNLTLSMIRITIEIYKKSIDFFINTFFITREFICNFKKSIYD